MTTTTQTYTDEFIEVAGNRVHMMKAGTGDPLLILHHDFGPTGWLPLHEQLAGRFTVYAPTTPGYGQSDRPAWMRSVRDLAVIYQWMLADLGLENVTLVGLGFGGWIAAEMATMSPGAFKRLVLVGAMGIQPARGEILDQSLVNHMDYVKAGLHNPAVFEQQFGANPETDQLEAWETNRETTFRIAWKPYMFSQTLPHLLGGVRAPALVVWGREDRIVPLECGERYAQALPNARLEVIEGCGHLVDLEKPEDLARIVTEFAGS